MSLQLMVKIDTPTESGILCFKSLAYKGAQWGARPLDMVQSIALAVTLEILADHLGTSAELSTGLRASSHAEFIPTWSDATLCVLSTVISTCSLVLAPHVDLSRW